MEITGSAKADKKQLLVAITGGIGAGKSLVATFYRELGYPVFSADEIAREITSANTPALQEIAAAFGPKAIVADGSLDRTYLRSRIAQDPKLRAKLDAITHPRIQARTEQLAKEAFGRGAGLVFYEAPLLFEAKSERKMDKVICVYADDEKRIERVLLRDGGDRALAEKLLKTQMPQEQKMQLADFLLENNGSQEELKEKAERLLTQLNR